MQDIYEKEYGHVCKPLSASTHALFVILCGAIRCKQCNSILFLFVDLLVRLAVQRLNDVADTFHGEDEIENVGVGFAFWDRPSHGNALPDVCRDGLKSAARKGGFKIFLLSYSDIPNCPSEVECATANEYLEALMMNCRVFQKTVSQCVMCHKSPLVLDQEEVARKYIDLHGVPMVSDLIRLLAIQKYTTRAKCAAPFLRELHLVIVCCDYISANF